MSERPAIIGYDGTDIAARAIRESADLIGQRPALVVVVWEGGRAFALADAPTISPGVPLSPVDIRTATELDYAAASAAQRTADQGAAIATELGLHAEGLAVADDASVAATLIRVATEHDASVIVVGTHGHRGITEFVLGSTARDLIRQAPCPVLVTRAEDRR